MRRRRERYTSAETCPDDEDEEESEEVPGIDDVLDDLSSFDVRMGLRLRRKWR